MEILVRLAGVQLGPYSEEQVRQHLAEGLLSLTDPAAIDGKEEWVTLAEALAQVARESRALPGPAGGTATLPLSEALKQREAGTAFPENPDAAQAMPADKTTELLKAPLAAPGMQHLPLRYSELAAESASTLGEKKTMPIGPSQPSAAPGVGPSTIPIATTSPLSSTPPQSKKTSRAALVRSLVQQTSPMASRPVSAPPRPAGTAPEDAPTTLLPKEPEGKKEGLPSLMRSLRAKTVPMRGGNTPPPPAAPPTPSSYAGISTPATTTPMPTRQVAKPSGPPPTPPPPPPGVAEGLTEQSVPADLEKKAALPKEPKPEKKLDPLVLPDSGPLMQPRLLSKEEREKLDETRAKQMEKEKALRGAVPRAPHLSLRLLPVLVCLGGLLAIVVPLYIWLPYHAAAKLKSALNSGDVAGLNATIDFPEVRASLKIQVEREAEALNLGASSDKVVAMLDNSIDQYVTPEGLAALATQTGDSGPAQEGEVISNDAATQVFSAFNAAPTKTEGLASLYDFVIDPGFALLHLRFHGLGWKLETVDLRPDWLEGPGSDGASNLLGPVVDTYLARGDAKAKEAAWGTAAEAYTQVLAIDPKSSAAYNGRGVALQAKGDLNGAIQDFTQAITLNPQLADAYNNRGTARVAKGDQDGALSDFSQAIQLNPQLATAFDSRGNAKAVKGDLEGAISDFGQAIAIDPNFANAYSDRGFVRQANGNVDGAIADYTAALALKPKSAIVYYNRGLARQGQGDLDAAIVDFNHALAFDPKIAGAYYYRANAKSAKNDLDGAIADYTQAIALNPKIAAAYSNRGQARQAKGDLDGAVADYSTALTLDPKIATAYFNRAAIKAQKNDLDGAIADSSQALDLDPKNVPALFTRGFARFTKGNLDGAADDFKEFGDSSPHNRDADRARIYLWIIARAQNAGGDPDQDLSNALENDWNSPPDDILTKAASFLVGRTMEADYLASAASANAATAPAQLCAAYYYVGIKRVLIGDKSGAIDAFQKSLATQQTHAPEFLLAQSEMNALQPAPATTAPGSGPTAPMPPAPPKP